MTGVGGVVWMYCGYHADVCVIENGSRGNFGVLRFLSVVVFHLFWTVFSYVRGPHIL